METKKYGYSKYQNMFAILLTSGMLAFAIYMLISMGSYYQVWLIIIPFILIILAMFAYVCKKFFFPSLRGDVALEIDKDKIQFFITKRIIYWRDVKDLYQSYFSNNGPYIMFKMKDGSKDIGISTKYIMGNNKDIYNTVIDYFNSYNGFTS